MQNIVVEYTAAGTVPEFHGIPFHRFFQKRKYYHLFGLNRPFVNSVVFLKFDWLMLQDFIFWKSLFPYFF